MGQPSRASYTCIPGKRSVKQISVMAIPAESMRHPNPEHHRPEDREMILIRCVLGRVNDDIAIKLDLHVAADLGEHLIELSRSGSPERPARRAAVELPATQPCSNTDAFCTPDISQSEV